MGHNSGQTGHHTRPMASGRMVILCLLSFFAMSVVGHYIFVASEDSHESAGPETGDARPADQEAPSP